MTPEQRLRRAIKAAVARLREVDLVEGCNADEPCLGLDPERIEAIAADLEHAEREDRCGR